MSSIYVFRTYDSQGKPRPRFRFCYRDWTGRRRSGVGTTSESETEKLAQRIQAEQDTIKMLSPRCAPESPAYDPEFHRQLFRDRPQYFGADGLPRPVSSRFFKPKR
jgi:hypothetical protein